MLSRDSCVTFKVRMPNRYRYPCQFVEMLFKVAILTKRLAKKYP